LITPARDEQAHLQRTIEGVCSQTVKPSRWIIVDDRSTDRTADIVSSYLPSCDFLRLLRISEGSGRHFGHKANAFNAGLQLLRDCEYEFIGNLDADIGLPPDYYENILAEFRSNPALGIAGGTVATRFRSGFVRLTVAADSVPGAVQLFRRGCFEQIGGAYMVLERGGIDAAAEIMARMKGWDVQSFPEYTVREFRLTGTASNGLLRSKYNEGTRFHSLGYGTVFYLMRAIYKMTDRPFLTGSIAAVAGFLAARLGQRPIALPSDVVAHLRAEQTLKLKWLMHNASLSLPRGESR
jgi:glycosyltransferase involved in cell wall biosynthesis